MQPRLCPTKKVLSSGLPMCWSRANCQEEMVGRSGLGIASESAWKPAARTCAESQSNQLPCGLPSKPCTIKTRRGMSITPFQTTCRVCRFTYYNTHCLFQFYRYPVYGG